MPENKHIWHLNEEEQKVVHDLVEDIAIEDMPEEIKNEKANEHIDQVNQWLNDVAKVVEKRTKAKYMKKK